MKRTLAALLVAAGVAAAIAPTAAFAHSPKSHGHGPKKGAAVVFGTICSYTASKSITVSSNCGTSSDVTVALEKHGKVVYEGSTSPAPAVATGDAAAAFLKWHKGTASVKKLEYAETAFGFAKAEIPGTYVSSTGDCASGTLTTLGQGKKAVQSTFNTDANTVYEANDAASTCATVTAAYVAKERINVAGVEMTDGSWYAKTVNALSGSKHKGH